MNYFAAIGAIGSTIEGFLASRTPIEEFSDREIPRKYRTDPNQLHYGLYLTKILHVAEMKEILSPNLIQKIRDFNDHVRNLVIHPKEGFQHYLGFKQTGYSGRKTSSRSSNYESPTGEPLTPLTAQKAALSGLELFLEIWRFYVNRLND
jgi:hypothetical protein